ncbi:S8 family peptidase [Photobacterium sp. SP02]|uniref:S8 family peptidase n=1 Tax=Photobacterium sp. SP02 TaxID=3032280 RepID=UPI0031456744
MKKHLKIKPKNNIYGFKAIGTPMNSTPYHVNKVGHYNAIKSSFSTAFSKSSQKITQIQTSLGIQEKPSKTVLTFVENKDNPKPLKIDSLDKNGMEILSVKKDNGTLIANVAIPTDKLLKLEKAIDSYGYEETKLGKPKQQEFIESISAIKESKLEDLWFSSNPFPEERTTVYSFEVWFNTTKDSVREIENNIDKLSYALDIRFSNKSIKFKERYVKIAFSSVENLEKLHFLTGTIAEIRPAGIISTDFIELTPCDQYEWVSDLEITHSDSRVPICIMDTGVNTEHPLLASSSDPTAQITYHPSWSAGDQRGHGTSMAGLAVLGDLKYTLQEPSVEVTSVIESAKILPDNGYNEPDLYGVITESLVYSIDAIRPSNNRIFTLAVTSDYTLSGAPSSWSATIDSLAAETPDDDTRRLFIISAGNVEPSMSAQFPYSCEISSVQDPANSYNAITVGYWASEDAISTPGHTLLSDLTDIGPTTTSSLTWGTQSPFKPDVIFEGGNYGFDSSCNFAADLEELSLVSTYHNFSSGVYLTPFRETSAATALAANFVSKLWSEYPDYWPETIRALTVHSAEWPQKLYERYAPYNNKRKVENLIRIAGFGYPNLRKAISSGDRSVNLVIEDQIQPYTPNGTLNSMILYTLPWPENELQKIAEQEVKLRVTLSYFVEPNPGERGWKNKYKYSSFGLRFDINSASEDSNEFVYRINKQFRDDNPDIDKGDSDSSQWLLGPKLRDRGSIHCDVWTGTAQELAEKKYIAVYPVGGWWKELKKENRQSSIGKFSLIVSIETKENNLTVHNEIENIIAIENLVTNTISI